MAKRFLVLAGINYLPSGKGAKEKRAEPGDIVTDLPADIIPVWLEQKVIQEAADVEKPR